MGADDSLAEIEEDIRRFSYDIEVRRRWLRTGLRLHLNPTRLSGRLKSSPAHASVIAFGSSTVNDSRFTVSVALVTSRWNGLLPSAN